MLRTSRVVGIACDTGGIRLQTQVFNIVAVPYDDQDVSGRQHSVASRVEHDVSTGILDGDYNDIKGRSDGAVPNGRIHEPRSRFDLYLVQFQVELVRHRREFHEIGPRPA